MNRSQNAIAIAEMVKTTPGLTRHGLMMKWRKGMACRNDYWYRDCEKALKANLIEDDNGKLYAKGKKYA